MTEQQMITEIHRLRQERDHLASTVEALSTENEALRCEIEVLLSAHSAA